MLLKPDGRINLAHRAYYFQGVPRQSALIAAAKDGQLTTMNTETREVQLHRLPSEIRSISPHPTDRSFAWVDDDNGLLTVQHPGGERVVEISPPPTHEVTPTWVQLGFGGCHFDDSGKFLWLAAPRAAGECEIQLIETGSWSLADQVTVEDPFGGSSCSFHPTTRPGLVSLWLAAGQDGQQVYWLHRNQSAFSCQPESRLQNTIPPVFSQSGDRVLVVNEDNAICHFDFPGMRQLGPPLESDDEDDRFAESLCYLDDQHALAATGEQRVFLVDLPRMRVEEEVIVEGHEPRPIREYYPTLANEPGLSTDLSYFRREGNTLAFVYRRDGGTDLAGWKDTILLFSVKDRQKGK